MIATHHVIRVSLIPPDASAATKLRAALDENRRNDTFSVEAGPVNEIILHAESEPRLEEIVDHLKSELGLDFTIGAPQVAYRETISKDLQWTYTHKQGHPAQYARVTLRFFPIGQGAGLKVENAFTGGALPAAFFPDVEAGIRHACKRGTYAEFRLPT